MGGLISTLMDMRNSMSLVPHPVLTGKREQLTLTLPGTETETTSAIYRHSRTGNEAEHRRIQEEYRARNCVQTLEEKCKTLGSRPAVAYRPLERLERRSVRNADGTERTLDYYHYRGRQVVSYEDLWHYITSFGSGLLELGVPQRSMITIYEDTRWEWLVSIYGIWTHNLVATTVYANLGEDALRYALSETDSAVIICSDRTLKMLLTLLRERGLHPIIVCLDSVPVDVDKGDYQIVAWTDVVKKGAEAKHAINIPTDNDIEALIMYTSGTSGDPKGVIHTHGSIAAGINALEERLSDLYNSTAETETYCAFLPLAHILEFGIVNIFLKRGSLVGFCNPRTLTDEFAIPHGDFKEFSPKIIIGVPRIFDTIKKGVERKIPSPNSLRRMIFDKAFTSRLSAIMREYDTPFWNQNVFNDALKLLGGKTYAMLSGGGPLSAETQEFIDVCFGGPILIQGWGLTETVCCGATQRLEYIATNDVGQLLVTAEMKLRDVDEYKHTDTPEPRGEILLRGPFLFKGYYKQEKLTREALDEDGWFHTGDVGSIAANGSLRIIGRVKALAKNVMGEYIALEALESMYVDNALCVPNGVCVLVHPARSYICALVLTDAVRAANFAKKHGLRGSLEDLLNNETFHEKAAESLAATAKKAGRKSFESVRYVRVLTDEWTPENGLMTPTSKLRRGNIEKHYTELIKQLFTKDR
ncbi:fatty acyl CoA synthetase 2 [Trypanosoma cruzi cruzi]|nr:fatty acyl CoA synthetase 2 [Trypanosoma cruzi cruzi]